MYFIVIWFILQIYKNINYKNIYLKNIMGKAKKETKPKSNRKNWVKNNKRIENNHKVLQELLESAK